MPERNLNKQPHTWRPGYKLFENDTEPQPVEEGQERFVGMRKKKLEDQKPH